MDVFVEREHGFKKVRSCSLWQFCTKRKQVRPIERILRKITPLELIIWNGPDNFRIWATKTLTNWNRWDLFERKGSDGKAVQKG